MHGRHFISVDQEKLPGPTRFAFGGWCSLQPLLLAGGTRRRVGVVAYVEQKKNNISMVRVNIAVTVRSSAGRWLAVATPPVPLPLD